MTSDQIAALVDLAAEAMWRRDYPNGGSVYKTYDSLNFEDKELHRKEVLALVGGAPTTLRPEIREEYAVLWDGPPRTSAEPVARDNERFSRLADEPLAVIPPGTVFELSGKSTRELMAERDAAIPVATDMLAWANRDLEGYMAHANAMLDKAGVPARFRRIDQTEMALATKARLATPPSSGSADAVREALVKSRAAIASLDEWALGGHTVENSDGSQSYQYAIRDEMLAGIDAALSSAPVAGADIIEQCAKVAQNYEDFGVIDEDSIGDVQQRDLRLADAIRALSRNDHGGSSNG